jgi:hypothetical protein
VTSLTPELEARFIELEVRLDTLISLLDEAEETFWRRYLARAINDVRERRLTGVTYVLGCYGGEETFSDLTLGTQALDARLVQLRTSIFAIADAIASSAARR